MMDSLKHRLTPFQKLVQDRRSLRRYQDKSVEREKILTCIQAARLAPSAENVQPWRFLIIDHPQQKNKFAQQVFSGIYRVSRFACKAPVLIMILARLDVIANRIGKQIQNVHFYLIDIGIAGEHIVLQAQELGLGTCWIGWFNQKKARKFFKVPRKYKIVSLLSMGYPQKKPSPAKKRKKLNQIAWFNRIGGESNE